jgi:hypothetical protein
VKEARRTSLAVGPFTVVRLPAGQGYAVADDRRRGRRIRYAVTETNAAGRLVPRPMTIGAALRMAGELHRNPP